MYRSAVVESTTFCFQLLTSNTHCSFLLYHICNCSECEKRIKNLIYFQMIDPVLSIAAALSVPSPLTNQAYTNIDFVVSYLQTFYLLASPFSVWLYVSCV